MYCIKCGVDLEDRAQRCPLCETPVPELEGLEDKEFVKEYPTININLYEMKMKKVKKAVFLSFFTISIFIYFSDIICVTNTAHGDKLSYIPKDIHIATKTSR